MKEKHHEIALFAAGCFWQVEEVFRKVEGVIETSVGYSGGTVSKPSYERVCSGDTGHAETVKVVFDPNVVSYNKLLDIFWNSHDPTTLNRQGPDVGEQYRSSIFYTTPEQRAIAQDSKKALEQLGKYKDPIVTHIAPASEFYRAEEYHQKYLAKREHR